MTYPTSGVYSAYNLGVEQHTTVSEDATQKMISKTPPVENKLDEFSKKSTYDAVDPKYEETYKTTSKDTTPTYHDEIVSKLPDSIVTTADSIYTATYQTTPTETSRYLEEKPNVMEMKTDAIHDVTTEPLPTPETPPKYREENSTDTPNVVEMTPVPTTGMEFSIMFELFRSTYQRLKLRKICITLISICIDFVICSSCLLQSINC